MIQPAELIEKFNYALKNGWGYIWGAAGEQWTAQKQAQATREQTVKWGKKWVGKRVADCSGLFVWAFKELNGKIYHGSNTIWRQYLADSGKIVKGKKENGAELLPGTAVFLTKGEDRHHIGLYVGDGKVIEAKGTAYGVVSSKVTAWDEWGELKAVNYGVINTENDESTQTVLTTDNKENYMKAKIYTANGGSVNVRTDASTNRPYIAQLAAGTEVDVVSTDGDWSAIRFNNGKSGYVMTKFLSFGTTTESASDTLDVKTQLTQIIASLQALVNQL